MEKLTGYKPRAPEGNQPAFRKEEKKEDKMIK